MSSQNVLIFSATGAVGAAVSFALAKRGANLWLSGRDRRKLEALKSALPPDGGDYSIHVVNATDEASVNAHVDEVFAIIAARGERIDGGFNAIGLTALEGGYPARAHEIDAATFMRPLETILRSMFITTRALGRMMTEQRHGAIVTITSALAGSQMPWMSGLTATSAAIEGLTRTLAAEYGPAGVRVNCVRADAMPETPSIACTAASAEAHGITREEFGRYVGLSLLGKPNSARQTAELVAFLMSDIASTITYQTFNAAARPLA